MPSWKQGPRTPRLDDRHVHVWRVDLARAPTGASGVLSPAEQGRAARFRSPTHRRRWEAAHVALRDVLSRYTGIDAAALTFAEGGDGKPALADDGGDDVRFSLAHSDEITLVAVARGVDVGVDVEAVDQPEALVEIARRVLPADAAGEIARLRGDARVARFFEAWTRHEAAVKCTGTGIVEPGVPVPSVAVRSVAVAPGYAAALASSVEPARVAMWRWSWPDEVVAAPVAPRR